MVLPKEETYCSCSSASLIVLLLWYECNGDDLKKKGDQSCLNHLTYRGAKVMSPVVQGLERGRKLVPRNI